MSKDLKCPYCGFDFDIDDRYGIKLDGGDNEATCENEECGKRFGFTAYESVTYCCEKADCLNGADHKWAVRWSAPRRGSKMACQDCGEVREMTAEEKFIFLEERQ